MEYRKLPHGEEQISIIGMGKQLSWRFGRRGSGKRRSPWRWKTASTILTWPPGMPRPFPPMAGWYPAAGIKCIIRSISVRITAAGKYGWTLDLDEIRRSVDWQLKALKTDYIDFGFISTVLMNFPTWKRQRRMEPSPT